MRHSIAVRSALRLSMPTTDRALVSAGAATSSAATASGAATGVARVVRAAMPHAQQPPPRRVVVPPTAALSASSDSAQAPRRATGAQQRAPPRRIVDLRSAPGTDRPAERRAAAAQLRLSINFKRRREKQQRADARRERAAREPCTFFCRRAEPAAWRPHARPRLCAADYAATAAAAVDPVAGCTHLPSAGTAGAFERTPSAPLTTTPPRSPLPPPALARRRREPAAATLRASHGRR